MASDNEKYGMDSIRKDIQIFVEGGTVIDNAILYENTFSLQQSICSNSYLRFGGCEASQVKFRMRSVCPYITGKQISVYIYIDGNESGKVKLGDFIVDKDTFSENRLYRDVVAYDYFYTKLNVDITDWYNSLTFPMTMRSFEMSLVSKLGLGWDAISRLIFDDIQINKKEITSLTGREALYDLMEVNAAFGTMSNNGGFYAKTLFNGYKIDMTSQISVQYEDVYAEPIIKVVFSDGENVGEYKLDDGNTYTIKDNLMLSGKTSTELTSMAQTFYNKVKDIKYKLVDRLYCKGNPYVTIGQCIRFKNGGTWFDTYILQRTMTGIQALKDVYVAQGEQYQPDVDVSASGSYAYASKQKSGSYSSLKIRWVDDESEVGNDPYTFYCIRK